LVRAAAAGATRRFAVPSANLGRIAASLRPSGRWTSHQVSPSGCPSRNMGEAKYSGRKKKSPVKDSPQHGTMGGEAAWRVLMEDLGIFHAGGRRSRSGSGAGSSWAWRAGSGTQRPSLATGPPAHCLRKYARCRGKRSGCGSPSASWRWQTPDLGRLPSAGSAGRRADRVGKRLQAGGWSCRGRWSLHAS